MTDPNHRNSREEAGSVGTDGGYNYEIADDEAPSEAVIRSVSSVRDAEPTELPPLYHTIDPDGLDELFGAALREESRSDARIEFSYAQCDVTVLASGSVIVEERE